LVASILAHPRGVGLRDRADWLAARLLSLTQWSIIFLAAALHRGVHFLKVITSAGGDCAINEGNIIIRFKPGIDKPMQLIVSAIPFDGLKLCPANTARELSRCGLDLV